MHPFLRCNVWLVRGRDRSTARRHRPRRREPHRSRARPVRPAARGRRDAPPLRPRRFAPRVPRSLRASGGRAVPREHRRRWAARSTGPASARSRGSTSPTRATCSPTSCSTRSPRPASTSTRTPWCRARRTTRSTKATCSTSATSRTRCCTCPGHSPDSIGLFDRATGTLFSGDAVYDGPLLEGFYDGGPEAYVATMERLRALPVAGGARRPRTQLRPRPPRGDLRRVPRRAG